jgi:hypothetical protein
MSATPQPNPLIEVVSASETPDGRQQAVVLIGRSTSVKLRGLGDERQKKVLKRYFACGLREFTSQQGTRIVARVPAKAVVVLDEVCDRMHTSRSRLLLARVERCVDASGEIIRKGYPAMVQSAIFSEQDWNDLVQIQVVAPRAQAKGFDRFCRKVLIQKNEFFAREIEIVVRRAAEERAVT